MAEYKEESRKGRQPAWRIEVDGRTVGRLVMDCGDWHVDGEAQRRLGWHGRTSRFVQMARINEALAAESPEKPT